MLFNSFEFIIFWIAVVCVFYLIPNNTWRKVFLLAASYYFYACWNVAFLAILLFETALSYGLGLSLGRDDVDKRKFKLCCGIILLLLPLLCFKYLNFILASVGDIIHATGLSIAVPQFKILLPVGISFYTFMAVGYVVDCYKHKIEAEKNILDYSLFVGFFPQIASGPIGRASLMLPQFKERHPLLYENIAAGAKMMLWGFFMKLVVGDRAGIYVDTVFGNYAQHNGVSLMLATFLYTIQIYCDFAGYSLIGIGTAKTMGYNLMTNFNRPYFSQTIGEFWRRWHISLSTWFRDYVYFPLGGSRCSHLKTYRNLLITFLVSGLWHGAVYNFILWGGVSCCNSNSWEEGSSKGGCRVFRAFCEYRYHLYPGSLRLDVVLCPGPPYGGRNHKRVLSSRYAVHPPDDYILLLCRFCDSVPERPKGRVLA